MAPVRVAVKAEMLDWALARSRVELVAAKARFPRFSDWRAGRAQPTLKQLEGFARATHTPVGFFFLPEPPDERVPIPDFRTIRDAGVGRPSADLLDTIYICQQRQEWYRDYARATGEQPLSFVGSIRPRSDVVAAAATIRTAIGFNLEQRQRTKTWEQALSDFLDKADELGVLVMKSGVVFNNTHRKLDPAEFRGFAMADTLAPVVFINGADTKSAQMFTLAHELVHLWIGQTALSDAPMVEESGPANDVERWCNEVAAELLVPLNALREAYNATADRLGEMQRLARRFKVSTLVILRRMYDAGGISRSEFWEAFAAERERLRDLASAGGGGDFHRTEQARVSPRFARALVVSTMEGHTLYRDAFRMLSIRKASTLHEFGRRLGVPI